jgi:uroporphyrinogen decarboxylase
MTGQERMDALFSYRKPDRVPVFGDDAFSMINCGYTLNDLQNDARKAYDAVHWTCEQYGWEPYGMLLGHTVLGSWDFGARMKMPDSVYAAAISADTAAVKTEEEVWNLELPDPRSAGAIPKRMEYYRLREEAGLPVVFCARSPFAMAADICGIERFARWLIKKPKLCEKLMQMAIDHTFNVMAYCVDAFGAEKVVAYMSSPTEANQLFSSRLVEKYALPRHREYHERLRELGVGRFYFHICGEQNANLPFLAEFAASADGWPHPSILSFGHEIALEDAARYFPEDIIAGNVDPTVFQSGPPQRVYDLCRMCIERGKKIPNGFILAPGCALPPRAPAYNVWMMTKAVCNCGRYD